MTTNSEWDVVVVGGINTDYLIRGESLPSTGETVEGEVFLQGPGGKGANQAVAVARLGGRVTMVGRVGQSLRGEAMIEALRTEGVNTQFVVRDERVDTGAAVIMVDRSGEKKILTAPGANRNVTIYDVLKAESAILGARVLLTQLEIPTVAVVQAVKIATTNNRRIVLDPAPPRPLDKNFLRNITIIKPNASEAEALTGVRVNDRASARTAAQRLIAEGAGAVAIQAGDEGNLLVWSDGEYWLSRIPVESIDATGAGDAFAGAMAFELAQNKSLIEAAKVANAAAALATTKLGAQAGLPRSEEIQSMLAKIEV